MRPAVLLLSLITLAQAQLHRVGVDERVELLAIVFRLAGADEYRKGRVAAYNQAIDRHFARFSEHEAVRMARRLRQTDGVAYDAVMNLAVRVKDISTLAERRPFTDPKLGLDQRWKGIKARAFLGAVRRFAVESKAVAFLESQRTLFEATNERMTAFVDQQADLKWFERFFGTHPKARFIVVPGVANGDSSYGATVVAEDGVEEIYAIPGVGVVDSDGLPRFEAAYLPILIHEFVHAYTNPLVDKFEKQLLAAGNQLLAATREEMERRAYGAAKPVLYESLVRAVVIRYTLDHQGRDVALRSIKQQRAMSFLWMGELFELLEEYAQNRQRYSTFEAFMPEAVKYFASAGARAGEMVRDYDAARPNVLSMTIKDGAEDVDPELKEVVIEFDRPMRSHVSITKDRKIEYPKFGQFGFDEGGKLFRISVALEPGKQYAFTLNWPGGGSFQSLDGVPLKPVPVTFRTRSGRAQPR